MATRGALEPTESATSTPCATWCAPRAPHHWIIDPRDETLTVHRWNPAGYIEVLVAQRGERVRAEPFQAVELPVGALFGEDEEP